MSDAKNSGAKTGFNQQLRNLKPWQQQVFALVLAQRSAPNYVLFCEALSWGDPSAFKQLLALLWEHWLAPESKINWVVQQEKLPLMAPEPGDFDVYGVYPALDAVMALELAVEGLIEVDAELAVRASRLSRSSVQAYLLESLAAEPETFSPPVGWVKQQPLMQDEQDFQDAVLEMLEQADRPRPALLQALKQLAHNQGVSNLGICLADD